MLMRMQRKGDPLTLLVGMQTGIGTLENSMEIPPKLKLELPYDLAIVLLGIYPKDTKTIIWRDTLTPMFMAALFTFCLSSKAVLHPLPVFPPVWAVFLLTPTFLYQVHIWRTTGCQESRDIKEDIERDGWEGEKQSSGIEGFRHP